MIGRQAGAFAAIGRASLIPPKVIPFLLGSPINAGKG